MDYSEIADSIAKTIAAAATPLTQTQKIVMAGAVAVWIEKAVELEREACAEACDRQAQLQSDTGADDCCISEAKRCARDIRLRYK